MACLPFTQREQRRFREREKEAGRGKKQYHHRGGYRRCLHGPSMDEPGDEGKKQKLNTVNLLKLAAHLRLTSRVSAPNLIGMPRLSFAPLGMALLLVAGTALGADKSTTAGVQIIEQPDKLRVEINGQLFTEYVY